MSQPLSSGQLSEALDTQSNMMSADHSWNLSVLIAVALAAIVYFAKYRANPSKLPSSDILTNEKAGGAAVSSPRDIVSIMEQRDKNCVVFFGSQTGTAEDYATRLVKEASTRFGLKAMIADLSDYDYGNLGAFPADKIAFFVVATYGEGEATDNATEFHSTLCGEESPFAQSDAALKNFHYTAIGLGNHTYARYNRMVRSVDEALLKYGASRIGELGLADDGNNSVEEDFLAWKEPMWQALSRHMDLQEHEVKYQPAYVITERQDLNRTHDQVFTGDIRKGQHAPYNAQNPYIATILEGRELFQTTQRNCVHLEIDISGSDLEYTTGDHIAVWPNNPNKEVDSFLKANDLLNKRHTVISIASSDSALKAALPSPTTYDAVARYYLEICAPVSRQFVAQLAQLAPNEQVKANLLSLAQDKDEFHTKVSNRLLNVSQLLEIFGGGLPWKVPFSLWIEELPKLQPRYYSISSSSAVQRNKVSITAAVKSYQAEGSPYTFWGVTTNMLLDIQRMAQGKLNVTSPELSYAFDGPRNMSNGSAVPIHIRHSSFRLPPDSSCPVIMVGPGTGVAPFRAFVQERALHAKLKKPIGMTMLFYGCRNSKEDFLYAEEWEQYQADLGDSFECLTAFSREGPAKVYVQHQLYEKAAQVDRLLQDGAYFYICGDAAGMAREVTETLVKIVAEQRQIDVEEAKVVVDRMRSSGRLQEDTW